MKKQENNFDWPKFFQFSLPYALLMAIINPEWGLFTIFFSGACFGLILTILTQPPEYQDYPDDESFTGQLPSELYIGHSETKKKLSFILSFTVISLFFIMGSLSLFIDLIDPQGAENFNKTIHVLFFYGLIPFIWMGHRTLSNYAIIKEDGIEVFQNDTLFGNQHRVANFKDIESAKVNIWGGVKINFYDGEIFQFGAIFGNDLSHYQEMVISEEKILNPNFRGSYQLAEYLKKKSKEDLKSSQQEYVEDKAA